MVKKNLKALSEKDIFAFFETMHLPRYRARQLLHWIYGMNVRSIDDVSEFSKTLRSTLSHETYISNLKLLHRHYSLDGTEKYLFEFDDSNTVETVLIPEDGRKTLCISSQVGCAMGCRFCLTGKSGFTRNLKSYEIVDQVLAVNRLISPLNITNIVFMGMGEPLANMEEVVEAVMRINGLIGISKRKITVSTAGITPQILPFVKKSPSVNIAFSLNATTEKSRNSIMPVNKRYSMNSVISVLRKIPLQKGRMITLEYVLIRGVNDAPNDAERLVRLVKGLRCKVNLIPLNPYKGCSLKRPRESAILRFQTILMQNGMRAFIRESRGQDILAACGQLRSSFVE